MFRCASATSLSAVMVLGASSPMRAKWSPPKSGRAVRNCADLWGGGTSFALSASGGPKAALRWRVPRSTGRCGSSTRSAVRKAWSRRSRQGRADKDLGFLGFAQSSPHGLTKARRDTLEGGQLDVLAAPTFNKAVLGPVHFNVVGKRLLGPLTGFTVPPDNPGDSMLQSRTSDSHAPTVRQASCKLRHMDVGYMSIADRSRVFGWRKVLPIETSKR